MENRFSSKINDIIRKDFNVKKLLLIWFAIAVALRFGVVVYADDFVPSVSAKHELEISGATDCNTGADVELIVTPMAEIDTLPNDIVKIFEKAYEGLSEANDLTKPVKELKRVARELGVNGKRLIVSDIFDISEKDFQTDETARYKISIKSDGAVLGKFAALLHYTDSQWQYVDNAKVCEDGETLAFEVEGLSPFAIVVVGDEAPSESLAPIVTVLWIVVGVFAAGGIAVAAVFFVKKTKEIS